MYDSAILAALKDATRPLFHRDLVEMLDPGKKDYAAFNNIGLALTRLYRAGLVKRERIRRDGTERRYYAYTLS